MNILTIELKKDLQNYHFNIPTLWYQACMRTYVAAAGQVS